MFDIGWAELLVIGSIMLIVVGPKDLPSMLRTMGQYAGKARAMAREFQRTVDDAAREADMGGLRDVQKSMSDFSRAASPRKNIESLLKDDAKTKTKPKAPAAGSLDAADAAEHAAWETEQAAKKAAEAGSAAETPAPPPATAPATAPAAAPAPATTPEAEAAKPAQDPAAEPRQRSA